MPRRNAPPSATTFMARTTPRPVGPWPEPFPFGDARAAVWLDGSTAGAAIAHWFHAAGANWLALVDELAPPPAREAAQAQARRLGVPLIHERAGTAVTTPVGWARAGEAAIAQQARWLVVPATRDDAEVPLPLRLHAAETALIAYGLEGLWAPLLGWKPVELGRLALSLEVPLAETVDCLDGSRCGACAGCRGRLRMVKQLGMADPGA